jgi:hypothetical protein
LLIDLIARLEERYRIWRKMPSNPLFDFDGHSVDPKKAQIFASESKTALHNFFYLNEGQVVHKWQHYLDIYDRHLDRYRNTDFKMLEIGVYKGGSLDLWRKYFGDKATIFGIDINPACANYATPPNQVRIGSQADEAFLAGVIDEMGAPDVILDDGSHVAKHQLASFEALWPRLREGGLYIIEDLHTSYWPGSYGGGYQRSGTAIEFSKLMIDDMHGWYHQKSQRMVNRAAIKSISFYDSIVIIEKGQVSPPRHIKVGTGAEEIRYKY